MMIRNLLYCVPVILLVLSGCGTRPLAADEAARVGDMVITMEDLNQEILRIPPYQRTSFESLQGKRTLLDHVIERELLLLAASEAGLESDSTVIAMVGDSDRQIDEVRTRAMGQVFYENVIIEGITISDSLVEDYYQRNMQVYYNYPTVRVSHILVSSEEAKSEALSMLNAGMPFDSVAIQLSEHAATAPQGGSMGWVGEHRDIPFVGEDQPLLETLLATDSGTVLAPYETNLGTHIFQVYERRDEYYESMEDVRSNIEDMLRPALVNDYFRNTFMPGLYEKYQVTVHEEPVDGVYALIGDDPITEEDILGELEAIPPYQRATYETLEGKLLIANSMLERELMRIAAVEEGFDSDSSVVAQVEQAEKQAEETLKGALIQAYYQQYVVEAAPVPEERVVAYYEEHTGDIYRQDPQVRVSVILTETRGQMDQAVTAAQETTFEAAVAEFSLHQPTAQIAGDLGWIPVNAPLPYFPGDLEFAQELYAAEPGAIFGPAATDQGLILLNVTDRLEEGVKPLEDVRESIEAALRPNVVNEYLYDTIFPQLRETYEVEINEDAFLPSESIGADSLMTLAQETMGTDPQTAIRYFRLYINRYPADERCDQAQFLIGFTFSEQLRNYEAARESFRILVESYPESELADDAQWMIENMETPIEEFIPSEVPEEDSETI